MQTPRFSATPFFYNDLKDRVHHYFQETNQAMTGNWRLHLKAIILVSSFFLCYAALVFYTPSVWASLLLCVVLGFIGAGIGFNVMHDGSHGSFSRFPFLNWLACFSLNVLGGSDSMWKVKHVILHHTFTNVDGVDDDIEIKPFMRMCKTQEWHTYHRYQHIYCMVLYAIHYLMWVLWFDYKKYFRQKIGDFEYQPLKWHEHLIFWLSKIGSYTMFFVIPTIYVGFTSMLVGFLVYTVVVGLVISIVFQLAHTVEHTDFPTPNDKNRIENEWAIHQVQTTANFATHNPIITWYCGGLNFQIEHHLFPTISHVHYPVISKIVKETCAAHNINYIEYPKMLTAVASHLRLLRQMGSSEFAI